jgi:DNA mismatch endonuclease, patch repair protein
MADIVDPQTRSRMMSGIRGKNTRPEILVRKFLHGRGFRFRLHNRKLPGSPDLVLPKYRSVVFVHGCFWHRHRGCRLAATPRTNTDFWITKLGKNVERDVRNRELLEAEGWAVSVVWECEINHERLEELARELQSRLKAKSP